MRRVCTGSFSVPLPTDRAEALFTPEGERAWVPGWAPEYPAGPGGPVFATHDGATLWIALGGLRYARFTPGVQAGTVAVRCHPDGDGGTRVRVTYDVTALSPSADLDGFAAGFGDMLREWERRIAAAVRAPAA